MCKICENNLRVATEWDCLRVEIVGESLEIGYEAYSTDSSFSTEIHILYCPFCGMKLTQ